MYETIHELPSQVRSSLDEADQEVFRKTYNDLAPKTAAEVREATRKAWRACKDLPSSFSFRIIASMDAVDKDGEVIDVDSVRKHLDSYIDYGGNIQWEHGNYQVGACWDWEPITKDGMKGIQVWGNIFGGDDVYDEMRKAFIDGRNSLSVAGEASKGRFQCDSRGCYVRRDVKQLLEISLCTTPANKHCTLQWYNENAKLTKSARDGTYIGFNVEEYEIHRDRDNCPIHRLRSELAGRGYPLAKATREGVFIPMSRTDYLLRADDLRWGGHYPYYDPDNKGTLVLSRDKGIEYAFRKHYPANEVDIEGRLTSRISKSSFERLYEAGLVENINGRYRLLIPGDDDV